MGMFTDTKNEDPENTAWIAFIYGSVGSVKLCLAMVFRIAGWSFSKTGCISWSIVGRGGVIIDSQHLFTAEKNNRI